MARWSPDHTLIAYSQGYEETLELWVVRANGTGRTRLTNNRFLDGWPSWAPGSRRLVVERWDPETSDDNELIIVRADGRGERNLTNNDEEDVCPDWAPDGTRIAFYRYGTWDIYTIKPDGSRLRRLTSGPDTDGAPKWSPNSKRILFSRHDWTTQQQDLFVVNKDGSRLRRLTNSLFEESIYGWSPDGKAIVFAGPQDGQFSIWAMRADGSHLRELVRNAGDRNALGPTWAEDGSSIVFSRLRTMRGAVRGDLWSVSLGGGEPHRLTDSPATERDPAWHHPFQNCLYGY